MAVIPITLFGDKILRKKVKPVNEVDLEIVALIKNMQETMKNAYGIGLAANQVGEDKSIFIVDISDVEGYEDIKPIVFINPKIVEYSDEKSSYEEGCLSIPDVRFDVERPTQIKIKYLDTNMNERELEADDLLARVIQHEYDHLQGILFTDLIGENVKKFNRLLNKIQKRKLDVDYPVTEKS